MIPKKNKIQKLIQALTSDGTEIDFSDFDKQVSKLKTSLKEKIQVQTLDDVNSEFDKFKSKISASVSSFTESVDKIRESIDERFNSLTQEIEAKTEELQGLTQAKDAESKNRENNLKQQLSDLTEQLSSLEEVRKSDISKYTGDFETFKKNYDEFETRMDEFFIYVAGRLDVLETPEEKTDFLPIIEDEINKLRLEIYSKLSGLGGGSMNRQIYIGGADPLSKYTDINLKAGAGTTITYSSNDTTKRTDVTVTATGTGSGIVRAVNSTAVSSVIGDTAGTDFVTICTQGVQVTLPTAVSNTNLYTIKNVSTSSILIGTTGGQTIDGSANLILATQYTSVDLISDSANWDIT